MLTSESARCRMELVRISNCPSKTESDQSRTKVFNGLLILLASAGPLLSLPCCSDSKLVDHRHHPRWPERGVDRDSYEQRQRVERIEVHLRRRERPVEALRQLNDTIYATNLG